MLRGHCDPGGSAVARSDLARRRGGGYGNESLGSARSRPRGGGDRSRSRARNARPAGRASRATARRRSERSRMAQRRPSSLHFRRGSRRSAAASPLPSRFCSKSTRRRSWIMTGSPPRVSSGTRSLRHRPKWCGCNKICSRVAEARLRRPPPQRAEAVRSPSAAPPSPRIPSAGSSPHREMISGGRSCHSRSRRDQTTYFDRRWREADYWRAVSIGDLQELSAADQIERSGPSHGHRAPASQSHAQLRGH